MDSLFNEISKAYQNTPDKIALIIDNQALSFRQLQNRVYAVSTELHQRGVCVKDKVIIVLPNNLEFVVTLLALAKLNATAVPLALGTSAHTFAVACKNTAAKHVISWHASITSYQKVAQQQELKIDSWVSVGKSIEAAQLFEAFYETQVIGALTLPSVDLNSPYILTMTSGSTGAPKPITLSQATKIKRAVSAIELYSVTDKDITMVATPLYHSLAERLLFVSLLSGGTAVIMAKFTVENWLQQIADHKATFTIAVSSQLKQILHCQSIPNLSSLRCIVSSSALLDTQVKQQLLDKLACEFHECYGASEVAIATNIKFDRNNPIDSVGKAIKGTELVVLDDSKKPVPMGEVGEIACKTPMIFSGYYQQPETTLLSFYQDYFCTGDLGRLDEAGNLFFVGRKKEIIITGGINVYPSDIEHSVKKVLGLDTAVAFAIEDEHLGEVVALALTIKDQHETNTVIQSIRIACATELDTQQQPRKYFVFSALPQNAMGKINKLEITRLATQISTPDQWLYIME